MSLTLHLGVVDLPYNKKGGLSTGDVAEFLEAKYHVMEVFYQENQEKVAAHLEDALQGTLENLLTGAPATQNPFGTAENKIKDDFDVFITDRVMEQLGFPGVPTKAAISRKSARFKKGKAKRERPSFVDTGLYLNSFASWVD